MSACVCGARGPQLLVGSERERGSVRAQCVRYARVPLEKTPGAQGKQAPGPAPGPPQRTPQDIIAEALREAQEEAAAKARI